MTGNDSKPLYCGSGVDAFHTSYKHWHGYVSLVVCILGTIANTLNVIVLSRREMRSPTNAILTGLAVADLAVMLEYIPYTIHDYILGDSLPRELQLSYSWACFIKFHSIFAQVLHTISIWLTVTLAVWRYIAVGYPQKNRMWCGMRTTIVTITTAYIVCILVVSPSLYLVSSIARFRETLDVNGRTLSSTPLSQYIIDYNREMEQQSSQQLMQLSDATQQQQQLHGTAIAAMSGMATVAATDNIATTAMTKLATLATLFNISTLEISRSTTTARYHSNFKDDDGVSSKSTISNYNLIKRLNKNSESITTATATATVTAIASSASEMGAELLNNGTLMLSEHELAQNSLDGDGPYRNVTVYRLYHSNLALRNKPLRNATFLIYSVLIKLIPCIALTILSIRLIAALLEAKRRRNMLTSNAANGMKSMVNGKVVERPRKNSKTLEKEKQTDRTTRMLLAVLLLFLITEFPQGIMGLLNTVLGDAFLMECYLKLSDLMDILALINSSINFILYCSMSRQFRSTFTLLFRPKFLDKWLPVSQDEDGALGDANGRLRGELGSKSGFGEQQFLTTQVTNV